MRWEQHKEKIIFDLISGQPAGITTGIYYGKLATNSNATPNNHLTICIWRHADTEYSLYLS